MSIKVFVDGQSGTTGLELNERLAKRPGLEMLMIDPALHRDSSEREKLLNAADVVFLCLPDAASREAVSMIHNDSTRVIDASTAFRCDDGWAYGFPELSPENREKIRHAKRVAVPGCYATGFTAAVHPLRAAGILAADYPLTCTAVSGYTGAGKKMIDAYEHRPEGETEFQYTRYYGLGLSHKHLPEMIKHNDLAEPPVFTPSVGDYARGMLVLLPLQRRLLKGEPGAEAVWELYRQTYAGERFVHVMPLNDAKSLDGNYLSPSGCNGTNRLEIFVYGRDGQILVISRLDNLGKGASGAAVQCMNLMFGQDEDTGLL